MKKKQLLALAALLLFAGLILAPIPMFQAARSSGVEVAFCAPSREDLSLDAGRMRVWRASLSVEVPVVSNAAARVAEWAGKAGGYVERRTDRGDRQTLLTLRLPSKALPNTLASIGELGRVTERNVSSEDVTERYVDTDARLRAMTALKDRLQGLLEKAQTVQDVLAIEKELGRIQGELESLQARLQALKGQVDLATVEVRLNRRRVLGPLGYLFKGAWWAVEKLFVIQK